MKNIVVFGGSSEIGQDLSGQLVRAGHSVVNIDHEKSEVEGVTRCPFDAGSSQTAGVLTVLKPDLVVNCSWFNEDLASERLEYIQQLCVILKYCEEFGIETYLPWKFSDSMDSLFEVINNFVAVEIRTDFLERVTELLETDL